jgi:hypothetical protein
MLQLELFASKCQGEHPMHAEVRAELEPESGRLAFGL